MLLIDLGKWMLSRSLRYFDLRTSSEKRLDRAAEQLVHSLTRWLSLSIIEAAINLPDKGVHEGNDNVVTNCTQHWQRMHILAHGITEPPLAGSAAYMVQRTMYATTDQPWTIDFDLHGFRETRQREAIIQAVNALVAASATLHLLGVEYNDRGYAYPFRIRVFTTLKLESPLASAP